MKVEIRIEASTNERRRLLGGADVTPMVELVSEMLDDAMMVVVEARLAALDERLPDAEAAAETAVDETSSAVARRAAR